MCRLLNSPWRGFSKAIMGTDFLCLFLSLSVPLARNFNTYLFNVSLKSPCLLLRSCELFYLFVFTTILFNLFFSSKHVNLFIYSISSCQAQGINVPIHFRKHKFQKYMRTLEEQSRLGKPIEILPFGFLLENLV